MGRRRISYTRRHYNYGCDLSIGAQLALLFALGMLIFVLLGT